MVLIQIFFSVQWKQSSFWPLADVKPMSKDLVHAMPWQCIFALYLWPHFTHQLHVFWNPAHLKETPGNTNGGSITVPFTSCLTGLESVVRQLTNFCFYLQNRLIQTSQTGGQWYSDTSPLVFPGDTYTICNFDPKHFFSHFLSPSASGRIRTLELKIMSRVFYHCAPAAGQHCGKPCF